MPDPKKPSKKAETNAIYDGLVTAERSVFGTRLPRPTGVGRHLVVVGILSVVALALAIYFAERGGAEQQPAKPAPAFKRPS